ncbi:threonine synthase [Halorussus halophilus]|uniref:threonine synthase n=1 Tax=Halorussus halophilus TaxID=2650975 RepID=UPI0017886882|nr:pyridoxal-phosphate dependent enzyme [Halorussus halophilus]
MNHTFECIFCGSRAAPADKSSSCTDCGGPLEVALDADELPSSLPETDRRDLWRYADFLPTEGITPISIGEGWTPLTELPTVSENPTVLLKNETTNPTWSWKDRLAAVVVPHAVAAGAEKIATSTSGNHGSAIAAYASRAGIEQVLTFVSPSSETPHHRQMRAYGAESLALTDYGERKNLLRELADRGWFVGYNLQNRYTAQPYVYEGYKTIAFELVEQLDKVPDAIVAPVGAGDGFYGIWKGFRELRELGIVETTPKMVSAESAERHPLAKAHQSDAETVGRDDGPEPLSTSTMGTTSGTHALQAVRDSDGAAYAADRETVEQAIRDCGHDGIFLEPASALAPAVVLQAIADNQLDASDTVVCVGTGAGVAWPEKTVEAVGTAPTVEPTVEAVAEAVSLDLD